MTEYVEQGSASDRLEAARNALAEYERSQPSDYERAYAEPLADALRALITPPSVGESVARMPKRILADFISREPFVAAKIGEARLARSVADLIAEGVRAGIQWAHERWEPADRPTQEQMLRWLGIKAVQSVEYPDRLVLHTSYIEKEEI